MTKEGGQDCHKNAKETGKTHLLSYNGSSFLYSNLYPPNHNPRKNDILEILPNEFHPEGVEL